MLRALGCLLVLSITLSACDLSDEPSPDDVPVLLPLAVGNEWVTDYSEEWIDRDLPGRSLVDTIRVVSAMTIAGETWYEVQNGGGSGFPDGLYTNRRDGVHQAANMFSPPELPDSVSVPEAAFLIYKFPAQVGDTYEAYDGIQVTVVDTRAPVTLPFGTFEAYVYEFRPTQAWFDGARPEMSIGFEEGAGVHYVYLVPELGYLDYQVPWVSTNGGTDDAPLWKTIMVGSWRLNALPTLLDEPTPLDEDNAGAVSPSARSNAQWHGELGAETGLLVGREATPILVGQRAVERPE
ncbi:MAG: hypothetical protein AAGF99_01320 [Bacteroidota bacterium]